MLENAVYSVISPEGCASILWKDASRAADAAESLRLTAEDALGFGVVERVISEKELGRESFYAELRAAVAEKLEELSALEPETLLARRAERFRKIGA